MTGSFKNTWHYWERVDFFYFWNTIFIGLGSETFCHRARLGFKRFFLSNSYNILDQKSLRISAQKVSRIIWMAPELRLVILSNMLFLTLLLELFSSSNTVVLNSSQKRPVLLNCFFMEPFLEQLHSTPSLELFRAFKSAAAPWLRTTDLVW